MPDPNNPQTIEQQAAAAPVVAPQQTPEPTQPDKIDDMLTSGMNYLQGIRARVAPTLDKVKQKAAPFVAAADAASGGAITAASTLLHSPQAKAVGEEAAQTIVNPEKRNAALQGIPQTALEIGNEDIIPPAITDEIPALKGLRARFIKSAEPEGQFKPAKPVARTTGNPELDARITQAGGTPGGVQKGFDYVDKKTGQPARYPDMAYVHHDSGSTINVPVDAPVEHIKQQLDNKTAEYAAASAPKEPESQTISTRVPTAVKATEDPLSHNLKVESSLINQTPGLAEKHANLVQEYPGVKISKKDLKDPSSTLDSFIGHVKDNLKWLYGQSTPEEQDANKGWYDGAHNFTKDLADKYGIEHRQTAGVTASLSPQKDWDMNVSLAQRVLDVHHNHGNEVATPEMIAKGNDIVKKTKGNETLANMIPRIEGKTYNQLTDPIEKAAWLRLYDEAHNPRQFEKIGPDGTPQGLRTTKKGEPSKVAWGSLNEIQKALSILQDGSKENISNLLGEQHKVRSFYNNIIEPNSPRGDTTIDTHAVAAGLLRPLSGKSVEVTHNFSGPGSNMTGLSGTYPLYQEAYRQAAKELDIEHPRQLQSVVWEKVRNLFPSTFKNEENNAAIDKIWKDHQNGKLTADQARNNILKYAQSKSGSGVTVPEGTRGASDQGKLSSSGVSRGQAGNGRRTASQLTEGTEGLAGSKSAKHTETMHQDIAPEDDMSNPDTRFGASRHEAGHAVVSELLNPGSVQSMELGESGGRTVVSAPGGKQTPQELNHDELTNMVARSYAGGLSEPGGTTTFHSSSDMKNRGKLMSANAGGFLNNASRMLTGKAAGEDPMLDIPKIQAEARARVSALLSDPKNTAAIDGLATHLTDKGKLSGKEVREFLDRETKINT